MLLGFLGVIGLSLSTDKSRYQVGDVPTYRLTGAIPGSTVAWTSYKNNSPTGEYNANYGQTVDPNGTAELVGGAFVEGDIGNWQKEVLIVAPDGSLSNAITSFSVSAKQVAPPAGSANASADFFSGNVTLPIVGTISKPVAIGGGLLLAYFLFSGKRGR